MNSIYYWQDKLPKSWSALPLKAIAYYNVSNVDKHSYDYEIPVRLCNYSDVYKNDYISADMEFMNATATEEEIEKYGLKEGDILITKDSETWNDIGIPALVVKTDEQLLCGYHLAIIKSDSDKVISRFLFHCLQSKDIRVQLELAASGVTRFGLSKYDVGRLIVPVPKTIHEQSKIVSYLEKAINQIDRLVETRETEITLLVEKRQVLITMAVTKGLNPKAKMKESGVDWLGEVPEGWEVMKMKYLSSLRSGDFITAEDIREDDSYPVFGGNGLRGYTSDKTHSGEFVLIGRQGALCGNINYAIGEFWASEHAIVCTPIKDYNVLWFGELLRVMNLNQYSAAAAQPGLSVEVIKNLSIPIPPPKEQDEIAKYLESNLKRIDEISKSTTKSIELLKERKAALITAAVTGQIKIE